MTTPHITLNLTLSERSAANLIAMLREVLPNGTTAPSVTLGNAAQCDGCNKGLHLTADLVHLDALGKPFMACTNATARPKKPRPAPKGDTAGFLRFWAAYPNKRGKGAARKAWHSKGCEKLTADIVAAVHQQAARDEQWRKDNGQYIPHPATWLRAERWEDAIGIELPKQEARMDDRSRRALEAM